MHIFSFFLSFIKCKITIHHYHQYCFRFSKRLIMKKKTRLRHHSAAFKTRARLSTEPAATWENKHKPKKKKMQDLKPATAHSSVFWAWTLRKAEGAAKEFTYCAVHKFLITRCWRHVQTKHSSQQQRRFRVENRCDAIRNTLTALPKVLSCFLY